MNIAISEFLILQLLIFEVRNVHVEQSFVLVVNVGFLISHFAMFDKIDQVFFSQEPLHKGSEDLLYLNFLLFHWSHQHIQVIDSELFLQLNFVKITNLRVAAFEALADLLYHIPEFCLHKEHHYLFGDVGTSVLLIVTLLHLHGHFFLRSLRLGQQRFNHL